MSAKCETCKSRNGSVKQRPNGSKLCDGCFTKCTNEILQNVPDNNKGEFISKDACVVNSLLCYVKCKISLIHTDTLVKVCTEKFSEKELAEAQALLYNRVNPAERLQKRKSDDMKIKTMYDIIKWFHECDDDALLYFVCDNVNTLPSVDIHDIDVNLLMKEISLMRYENMQVKDTCQQVVNECAEGMEKLQRVVFQLGNNIKATIDAPIEKMSRQQTRLENHCVKHITDVRDNILSILNDSLADPMVSRCDTVPQAQGTSGTVQLDNEHSADGLAPCLSADSQLHGATANDQVHVEPVDSQSLGGADTDIKMTCSAGTQEGTSDDQDEPFPALERRAPSPGPTPFVQTVFPPSSTAGAPDMALMAARPPVPSSNRSMNAHRQSNIRGGSLRAAPVPSGTYLGLIQPPQRNNCLNIWNHEALGSVMLKP